MMASFQPVVPGVLFPDGFLVFIVVICNVFCVLSYKCNFLCQKVVRRTNRISRTNQ
jgi:hypothetical protein